jgi:hypothetical protein
MRLGRAAARGTGSRAPTPSGSGAVDACAIAQPRAAQDIALAIYPWDIVTELETRLEARRRCSSSCRTAR